MNGGLSPRNAIRRCCLLLSSTLLAGCGALFSAPPAPPPEAAAEPAPASEEAVPASEPVASEPEAASAPEPANTKRVQPKPAPRPAPRPHPAPAPTRPPVAPAPPAPLVAVRTLAPNDTHSLLDARIQRPDGKAIGRAIDLYVDASGKPREMLVNLTGFLGIGDRKVRFPWTAFKFGLGGKKTAVTLAVPPGEPPAAEAAKAKGKPAAAPLLGLIDATVERGNGARVGRVVDVLVDSHAQPQAAVVDVGSLIHERRSIAADWSALHVVTKDDGLALETDLSDAQVNAAPPYVAEQPARVVAPASAPAASAVPAASAAAPTR